LAFKRVGNAPRVRAYAKSLWVTLLGQGKRYNSSCSEQGHGAGNTTTPGGFLLFKEGFLGPNHFRREPRLLAVTPLCSQTRGPKQTGHFSPKCCSPPRKRVFGGNSSVVPPKGKGSHQATRGAPLTFKARVSHWAQIFGGRAFVYTQGGFQRKGGPLGFFPQKGIGAKNGRNTYGAGTRQHIFRRQLRIFHLLNSPLYFSWKNPLYGLGFSYHFSQHEGANIYWATNQGRAPICVISIAPHLCGGKTRVAFPPGERRAP